MVAQNLGGVKRFREAAPKSIPRLSHIDSIKLFIEPIMEAIFLHIPTQLQSQRGNSPIGKMAHFGGVGRLYHVNRILEP